MLLKYLSQTTTKAVGYKDAAEFAQVRLQLNYVSGAFMEATLLNHSLGFGYCRATGQTEAGLPNTKATMLNSTWRTDMPDN